MVSPSAPVSLESLQTAFSLAEERLRGEENRTIAQQISDEAKNVKYEGSLNGIFRSAFSDSLPDYSVRSEYNKIDICIMREDVIVTAVESKGMVANSHSGDGNRSALALHGINTKLNPDGRSPNCIQSDIAGIKRKLAAHTSGPHIEVFVPVVYELYRGGGSTQDLYSERKPWVTPREFKQMRRGMRDDFAKWFHREDAKINLIHAAESAPLRDANELWLEHAKHKFPKFTSLEAFVSFYAFARFVE